MIGEVITLVGALLILLTAVGMVRFDDVIANWLQSVEAAKHYPAMKSKWVEFLGEKASEETSRVEETGEAAA